MKVIYENHSFYQGYFFTLIIGLIFLSLVTFGWRFIVKYIKHKQLYMRIFLSLFAIFPLCSIIPDTLDIPSVNHHHYELTSGELTNVSYIDTYRSNSRIVDHETVLTVDGKKFTLYNKYPNAEKLKTFTLNVYYLPHTYKVVKIAIPYTKENLSKASKW